MTADYRIAKNEILNWYNRVTKQIAKEVNVELTPLEESLLSKSRVVDKQVYEDYLRANLLGDMRKESLQRALEYLNNAISEEPDWAPLYSGLAQTWLVLQQGGFEPPSTAMPEIYKNLNKALELDPNFSEAHSLNAMIAYLVEWNWEKGEKEYLEALAVNPNDAGSRALYAQLLCILQRSDEGVAQGRLAMELDPLNSNVKLLSSATLPCVGDCKTALTLAEEVSADDPGNYLANQGIYMLAYKCKEYNKVFKAEKYNLSMFDVTEDDMKEIESIFNEQGFVKAYEKIMIHLERFAEKNFIQPIEMATRYIMADQPEKAMDWLEKGYKLNDPTMPYIATEIFVFAPLFKNPRFIDIIKKMNLPLPKSD